MTVTTPAIVIEFLKYERLCKDSNKKPMSFNKWKDAGQPKEP